MKTEFTEKEIREAEKRILMEFAQAVIDGNLPVIGIEYRKNHMKVFVSAMEKLIAEKKAAFIRVHENKKFYRLISQEEKTA